MIKYTYNYLLQYNLNNFKPNMFYLISKKFIFPKSNIRFMKLNLVNVTDCKSLVTIEYILQSFLNLRVNNFLFLETENMFLEIPPNKNRSTYAAVRLKCRAKISRRVLKI